MGKQLYLGTMGSMKVLQTTRVRSKGRAGRGDSVEFGVETLSAVGLQEQGFVDDTLQFVVDASSAIGSTSATQLLAATVGASGACFQSLLADCVAAGRVHDDAVVVVKRAFKKSAKKNMEALVVAREKLITGSTDCGEERKKERQNYKDQKMWEEEAK